MLDVTLLKVHHQGFAEADRTLHHIKRCDVFAPETTLAPQPIVAARERDWHMVLKMPAKAVMAFLRSNTIDKSSEHMPLDAAQYAFRIEQHLFYEKKPMIHLERWDPKVADGLRTEIYKMPELARQGLDKLWALDMGGFLKDFGAGIQILANNRQIRDVHIGANLMSAESRIRESWDELRNKEPLKLTMALGSAHSPERYTKGIPITIVDLVNKSVRDELATRLVGEDVRSDRDLLAQGLVDLSIGNKPIQLSDRDITHATFEELRSILESSRKGAIKPRN